MKKFFIRAMCLSLIISSLITSLLPSQASIKDVKIIGSVDYSEKGTVIDGDIAIGNEAIASGSYLYVPVYKGKYEAGSFNYWWTKSWSGWSINNNKKNPDFTKYNGTKYATEYNVESRKEHQYKRMQEQDVYSKKYYTVYVGTKWYNSWRTITKGQWNGYYGNMSGYKIVNKYTRMEKNGTREMMYYDKTWRTSAPFSFPWENDWTAYSTRTTYRYRSRTLTWNNKALVGKEQVPLYYSLYKQNGKPIDLGIKLDINRDISKQDGLFSTHSCYDVTQYYIHIDAIERELHTVITSAANDSDPAMSFMKSVISKGVWATLGLALKKCGKEAVFKSLGAYAFLAQICLTAMDAGLQQAKADTINEYNNVLKSIDDGKKILLIQKTRYQNTNYGSNGFPVDWVDVVLIEEDIKYISAKYDARRANKYDLFDYFNNNYYGEVSYIKSKSEITDVLLDYLDSFDILNWASLIPD